MQQPRKCHLQYVHIANEGLESRMNETLPQINKKKKNNSTEFSGSREAPGRRGNAGGARQRKDASSPSHRVGKAIQQCNSTAYLEVAVEGAQQAISCLEEGGRGSSGNIWPS